MPLIPKITKVKMLTSKSQSPQLIFTVVVVGFLAFVCVTFFLHSMMSVPFLIVTLVITFYSVQPSKVNQGKLNYYSVGLALFFIVKKFLERKR